MGFMNLLMIVKDVGSICQFGGGGTAFKRALPIVTAIGARSLIKVTLQPIQKFEGKRQLDMDVKIFAMVFSLYYRNSPY